MPALGELLRTVPYFQGLGEAEIAGLESKVVERALARGEVLFLEGEPCRGLYLVRSGRIRVFKSSPEGREQVLFVAREGDSFNDVPVFDGGPNPASAAALEPSTVYLLPNETVLALIADCPAAAGIIKVFAGRLRHLTGVVEDLSFRSVVSRVARMLLDLAVAENGPAPVPRLTQEEMATMVGSVRDVIGRALRALEKAGAIKIQGQRIAVVDPAKLKEVA